MKDFTTIEKGPGDAPGATGVEKGVDHGLIRGNLAHPISGPGGVLPPATTDGAWEGTQSK